MNIAGIAAMQPPQVKIFYHPEAKEMLAQVQYGLEEEGVPFSCEEQKEYSSIVKLGFQAAEASVLGVGVGIGQDQTLVLHYYRLHWDFPLFLLPGEDYIPQLGRIIGSNAARLVKGEPFKPLKFQEELTAEENLVQLVTRLVYQILAEGRG